METRFAPLLIRWVRAMAARGTPTEDICRQTGLQPEVVHYLKGLTLVGEVRSR